jgi:hypothetical protein
MLPTAVRRSSILALAAILAAASCGDGPVTPPATTAYTDAELRHFTELAFGTDPDASAIIRRWTAPIRVAFEGEPTSADESVLAATLGEIAGASRGRLELGMAADEEEPNMVIHVVPRAVAEEIEPDIERWHIGYFRVWWRGDGSFALARIVLVSDGISGQTRDYIIRHEVMHAVGFLRHAPLDRGSIMYESYSGTSRFSNLDVAVMEMLYRDDIVPGMPRSTALDLLRGLPAGSRSLGITIGGDDEQLISEGHGIAAGH